MRTLTLSQMTTTELIEADREVGHRLNKHFDPADLERRSISSGFPMHIIEGNARDRAAKDFQARREIRAEIDRRKAQQS